MTVADPVAPEYLWLVVVGAFAAFVFGFGTGANDVANAFGTSVGAKTLSLRQAVVIAIIFEFVGAMVLGRVSTNTIAGGIADITAFQREPEVYAYGMVCALTVGGLWQIGASYYELNVSATHSIIGCIMGFALVYAGRNGVLWADPSPNAFPPYNGVVPILFSWLFSPILTGIASAIIFFLTRLLILRRQNSYNKAFWVLPPLVLATIYVCIYFVLTKGAKKTIQNDNDDWDDSKAAWVTAIIAAGFFAIACAITPLLKWKLDNRWAAEALEASHNKDIAVMSAKEASAIDIEVATLHQTDLPNSVKQAATDGSGSATEDPKAPHKLAIAPSLEHTNSLKGKFIAALNTSKRVLLHGTSVDIHQVVEEDEVVAAIHANAEVFDPKAESVFSYLQVFSAICVIFAHGAGEVGYMAGPLATIWSAYTEGALPSKVNAPAWVVLIGALGLVVGLATYGYNVTRAMGVKLSKLTPSRGFAAELSTALVILIASQHALPTSSSQCITGGIIGLGLLEGRLGVNWWYLAKQVTSWAATLIMCGLLTAALFSQAVFAPSLPQGQQIQFYENAVTTVTNSLFKDINTTLYSYRAAVEAGAVPNLDIATWNSTVTSIAKLNSAASNSIKATGSQGTIYPGEVMLYLYKALTLHSQNSITTIGQVDVVPDARLCNNATTATDPNAPKVSCPRDKLVPFSIAPADAAFP